MKKRLIFFLFTLSILVGSQLVIDVQRQTSVNSIDQLLKTLETQGIGYVKSYDHGGEVINIQFEDFIRRQGVDKSVAILSKVQNILSREKNPLIPLTREEEIKLSLLTQMHQAIQEPQMQAEMRIVLQFEDLQALEGDLIETHLLDEELNQEAIKLSEFENSSKQFTQSLEGFKTQFGALSESLLRLANKLEVMEESYRLVLEEQRAIRTGASDLRVHLSE